MAEETTPAKVFKILDLTKVPSAEAGRIGKYDLLVTYQDAAGRVRITKLPYEQFEGKSEEEQEKLIREAILREESERLKFIGREIKL